MRNRSPQWLAGYDARLTGQLSHQNPLTGTDAHRKAGLWSRGWQAANEVKRGERKCVVCDGGHASTLACLAASPGVETLPAPPSLSDRLRALIADGLTYSEAAQVFGDHQDATAPHLKAYREAAQRLPGDALEVDSCAMVSEGSDPGAYVQAWVWVSNEDAGVTTEEEGEDDAEA